MLIVGITNTVSAINVEWSPDEFLENIDNGTDYTGYNITLSSGETNVSKDYIIDKDNVIITAKNVIFRGNTSYNQFQITGSNVTLQGITFNDFKGLESYEGGAIRWSGENGKLISCKFYNNTIFNSYDEGEGGAVYWYGDNGFISDCIFINNSVGDYGGAIRWSGDNGKIINCKFYNNIAKDQNRSDSDYGNGGAIELSGDNCFISNCIFTNNTSVYGGAIDQSGINTTIRNCNFITNIAHLGGAIVYEDENGTIDNCTFINNTANSDGGAIITLTTFNLINSTFEKCSSNNGGIIVLMSNVNSTISGCNFIYCNGLTIIKLITYFGYEIVNSNNSLNNNNFINCSCDFYNGAVIYNEGNNLSVSGGSNALIYNVGTISSPINVIILNNETLTVAKDSEVELTAIIKTGNHTVISPYLNFKVGNETVKGKLTDDYFRAIYTITSDAGNKIFVNGNYAYGENISYKTATLLIKNAVSISSGVITVPYSDKITLTLNVTSNGGKINMGTVNITIDGYEGIYSGNVKDGKVDILLPNLKVGVYNLKALYLENSIYLGANSNITLNIISISPSGFDLIGYNVYKEFENDTQYYAKVTDNTGIPLSGMIVLVSLNSSKWAKEANYTIVTDKDGIATLTINLLPGNYNITAHFADKIANNNITVIATNFNLKADSFVKYFKNDTQYTVKVTDVNNNPVANRTVTITINKATWKNPAKYYVKTNADGIATLDINLIAGTYSVTAQICYNSTKSTITVLPTLTASNLVKKLSQSANLKAKLVDGQGNPSKNKDIQFIVKDKVYTFTTNSAGVATLPIHLGVGTWSILIANPETGAQTRATVKVTR